VSAGGSVGERAYLWRYVSLKRKHNNHVFAKVNILFDKSAKTIFKKS
jgi:hypothetical protein